MNSLSIKNTTEASDAAEFLAASILRELRRGKRVLWFATGGSSVRVGILVAKILSEDGGDACGNLTVTLTDERYVEPGHADSNWHELMEGGFDIPGAELIPVLGGGDMEETNKKWSGILEEEMKNADFRIGLFGIGADGHTAGILPGSPAVDAAGPSAAYSGGKFERITITPETVIKLNEAVAFVQGEPKWPIIEDLEGGDKSISEQPAQILKQIPTLTIFTDYKNNKL